MLKLNQILLKKSNRPQTFVLFFKYIYYNSSSFCSFHFNLTLNPCINSTLAVSASCLLPQFKLGNRHSEFDSEWQKTLVRRCI